VAEDYRDRTAVCQDRVTTSGTGRNNCRTDPTVGIRYPIVQTSSGFASGVRGELLAEDPEQSADIEIRRAGRIESTTA
jgi:hypothetical protein